MTMKMIMFIVCLFLMVFIMMTQLGLEGGVTSERTTTESCSAIKTSVDPSGNNSPSELNSPKLRKRSSGNCATNQDDDEQRSHEKKVTLPRLVSFSWQMNFSVNDTGVLGKENLSSSNRSPIYNLPITTTEVWPLILVHVTTILPAYF